LLETIAIYFILFALWMEPTFGTKLTNVKGLSLGNLAFFFACVVWTISFALKRVNFSLNKIYIYIFFLILYVVLSIPYKYLIGDYGHFSIMRELVPLKSWLEPFLYLIIIFNLASNKEILKNTTYGVMIVLMLTVIVTILTVSRIYPIGRIQIEHGGYWPVFAEPNQYAAYLVLTLPLFISFALLCNRVFLKILYSCCSIAIFCALISSGSRGGLLSFCVSVFTFLLLLKGSKEKIKKGLIAGGVVILLIVVTTMLVLPSWIEDRTTQRIEYKNGTDLNEYSSGRIDIWKEHFSHFIKNPVFGIGFDGSRKLLATSAVQANSHNTYLLYLTDSGIIGFLLFIVFISTILRESIKGLRQATDKFGIILFSGFVSGLVGYIVAIFFVNVLDLWSLIMILFAVVLKYAQIDSINKECTN
jgi:O-antigen ligase